MNMNYHTNTTNTLGKIQASSQHVCDKSINSVLTLVMPMLIFVLTLVTSMGISLKSILLTFVPTLMPLLCFVGGSLLMMYWIHG